MERSSDVHEELAALRAALAVSASRFHNIIEKNADGILVMRPDGTIRYANPAAINLLRKTPEELIGKAFGIPIIAGETTEIDLPLASGDVRVADMRVVETDWEGEPALLATLRDISERKSLETQLRQKVGELADADRRKDEFLAMLAHELRNPLAPVRNALYIMKHRGRDETLLARAREIIEQEVSSMTRLVDDLLDVSRITTGKITLRPQQITLHAIIDKAVESTRPLFESKRHALRVEIPGGPIGLFADPVRIEQILVNLLTNAAKYTDLDGSIELEGRAHGGTVFVSVRDNGMGIAPEMLGRIFDLFQQAEDDLDRSLGGLGIGLTLARRLARLHGGELTAQSEGLGCGSEFLLSLPLGDMSAASGNPAAAAEEPASGQGRRILVVDDHQAMTESLSGVLRFWGHDCRVARNGLEAINEASAYHPDVILIDIGLPGMNGFEVARQLRRASGLPRLELVAMSGFGRFQDRVRGREAGFDGYLIKPLDLAVLQKLLKAPETITTTDQS